jgi:polyhydroxyalkanoate synthesis regulator phasin
MRIVIDRLCGYIEDLVKHGPLKPEETRGLTHDMVMDKK